MDSIAALLEAIKRVQADLGQKRVTDMMSAGDSSEGEPVAVEVEVTSASPADVSDLGDGLPAMMAATTEAEPEAGAPSDPAALVRVLAERYPEILTECERILAGGSE